MNKKNNNVKCRLKAVSSDIKSKLSYLYMCIWNYGVNINKHVCCGKSAGIKPKFSYS